MISLIREELISLGMREFRWDRIEGERVLVEVVEEMEM